jgi:hypothetical protein
MEQQCTFNKEEFELAMDRLKMSICSGKIPQSKREDLMSHFDDVLSALAGKPIAKNSRHDMTLRLTGRKFASTSPSKTHHKRRSSADKLFSTPRRPALQHHQKK